MTKTKGTLAVIGGGLAGITAAEYASQNGFKTTLFERSKVLGGRAASLFDPNVNQWVDTGQHLVLGCCTEFLALNKRLGLSHFFDQRESFPFAQIDSKKWTMTSAPFLPKRWQLVLSFLRIPFLSWTERLHTGRLLQKIGCRKKLPGTFAEYLITNRASSNSIDKFWTPLCLSALSDTIENTACEAMQKVVQEAFLSGQNAMSIHIPTVPLRFIYHGSASEALVKHGVEIRFFRRISRLHWKEGAGETPIITSLETADGSVHHFDHYILAIPVFNVWKVLEASDLGEYAEQLSLDRFEPGAITTVHLWLDRPLLSASGGHTILLGGAGQFLCCPYRLTEPGYHTVVISASHRLLSENEMLGKENGLLVERILQQLRLTFGDHSFQLQNYRVTTSFDAVFSPKPSIYGVRPAQETIFPNLAFAGDWTQTDLPATLEGAVRSGNRAVRCLQ
ncbi:phytoene dehydrogenase [Planctomycetales bacterium]|nr:phytoene dehydrogenase [Planctomycetales bacterium]